MKLIFLSLSLIVVYLHSSEANLSVQGKKLAYNGQTVFLSGTNIAWKQYAYDFGSGQYWKVKDQYEKWIDEVANNGGNTIRVWVHINGASSPKWSGGYASGADTESLTSELGSLLDKAASRNVFVILVLWNLAETPGEELKNMFYDEGKLNTYLDKVLKPMAKNLSGKKALAAWEIINEPGGSVAIQGDSNKCFDTTNLGNSGAGWKGTKLPMKNILKFINLSIAAIKSVAGNILCTVGEWSEKGTSNMCSECRNYYTDQCLRAAGGQNSGVLDFYQIHTYLDKPYSGKYNPSSPFFKVSADYGFDKPVLVGEFAAVCSEDKDAARNYQRYYNADYAGALNWQYNGGGECSDKPGDADNGMRSIKDRTDKGKVKIQL